MKTSCIIPTRDRKEMVVGAIESALGQQGGAPEVVVVDDASVDGTKDAVRRRFSEVQVISTPGVGPGGARNAGARAAQGDILMFLDSDDLWLPHHVTSLVPLLEQGFHLAYGVTKTENCLRKEGFLIPEPGEGVSGDCFDRLVNWCFLVPSSVAVTRKAFRAVGGFIEGDVGEDWAFFLALAAEYPFGFTRRVITHRFLHQGSLCCLRNGIRDIRGALWRIREVLKKTDRATPEHFGRIRHMDLLAAEKGASWETIQDWYTTLKGRGLV